jgi:hypothetical protein
VDCDRRRGEADRETWSCKDRKAASSGPPVPGGPSTGATSCLLHGRTLEDCQPSVQPISFRVDKKSVSKVCLPVVRESVVSPGMDCRPYIHNQLDSRQSGTVFQC